MPPTRRDFLARSAALTAGVLLTGCEGNSPQTLRAVKQSIFQHGVASGDPLQDRVILWTRASRVGDGTVIDWVVARDPQLQQVVRRSGDGVDQQPQVVEAARDFTVKLDVSGLQPGTTYYYQFTIDGEASPIGRTKTLPSAGVDRVRLGLVACSNFSNGWFNAYKVLARRDVDAVLHVGDYFYEYSGSNSPIGRPHEPEKETVSLSDYRMRHAQYRTDPDLAEMTRQHPLIAVWDDHESANNSWIDGAEEHDPATEGDWDTRKSAAALAYAEWMPIRLPKPQDPLTIWRRFEFGDLVDLFMLDTRLQRNAPEIETINDPAADDPTRSMMGAEQKAWLKEGLQQSASRNTAWRILGQQTMISPHRGFLQGEVPLPYLPEEVAQEMGIRQGGGNEGTDNWAAYVAERNELMAFLRDGGIANNVVLTGDIHTAWAADITEDPYTLFNPITPNITGVPGYNPITGQGSVGVEFVAMSVTSNNAIDFVPDAQTAAEVAAEGYNLGVELGNPNVMHHNAAIHGFVLIDATPDRVQGEFWQTGPASIPLADTADATLDEAWQSRRGAPGAIGTDHLVPALSASAPRANAPTPAP